LTQKSDAGITAAAAERFDVAETRFQTGVDQADASFALARSEARLWYADMLIQRAGDRARAGALLDEAIEIAHGYGLAAFEPHARSLLTGSRRTWAGPSGPAFPIRHSGPGPAVGVFRPLCGQSPGLKTRGSIPHMADWIVALVTLTVLEVILGVDNVIFISILSGKLPKDQQRLARRVGLGAAMLMRLVLLAFIAWIAGLTQPLFSLFEHAFSGRDLILLGGGLFLLAKATWEIHDKLEGAEHGAARAAASFASVITQVMVLDMVFSLDSVITAIGMADQLSVMMTAVILAVLVMLVAAEPISAFVEKHPTIKILALSFLLLIGLSLVVEGLGQHISKGYIYFAMGFSVFVEMINIRVRRKAEPVQLHQRITD
jgi:predicted tellurium resistance membrane protein TerC